MGAATWVLTVASVAVVLLSGGPGRHGGDVVSSMMMMPVEAGEALGDVAGGLASAPDLVVEEDDDDEEEREEGVCVECESGAMAGNQTVEEIEVEDVAWEDITGNLTVVNPTPGSEVEGSAVAVQLNVNTNCVNVTRFQEKFNSSHICISMDSSPYSCWPMVGLSRFPLYTNLSMGEHTLVAKLVDPETGEMLIDESMAESVFTMIPKNETEADSKTKRPEQDDDEKSVDDQDSEDEEPKTETIAIPQVGVEYPVPGVAVPPTFEVRLNIVTEANITQFKRLFENSFICLSLDEAAQLSCYPIFEESYFPRFFDLAKGEHSITAFISHPNTLEPLIGSSMEARQFWVTERNQGMIPMTLREPSMGSNAFDETLQEQALKEAGVPVGGAEDPATRAAAAHTQELFTDSDGDEDDAAAGKGTFVSLQINVDNVRHTLRVFEDDEVVPVAARFCVKHDIIGQNCVSSISRLIELEWKKLREIPHIELYTQ